MSFPRTLDNDFVREAARLHRDQFAIGYALRNALGMLLALGIGFAAGATEWGMYAAIGALVTGFSDLGLTRLRRTRAMLICSVVATISAIAGAWAAGNDISAALTIAVWGLLGGLLVALGPAESLIAKLAILSLILIGGDPASSSDALEIGLAVGAGCLIQTFLTALVPTPTVTSDKSPLGQGERWNALKSAASLDQVVGRHALRLALALTAGLIFYRRTEVGHGLWIPLTVLFVLQPNPSETMHKVFDRIVGTLLGVVAVTALVALLEPSYVLMGLMACAFAVPQYAFFRANYALFSGSIAACVVLLTAIGGIPEADAALYRAVDTLIGGAFALAAVYLIPMPGEERRLGGRDK